MSAPDVAVPGSAIDYTPRSIGVMRMGGHRFVQPLACRRSNRPALVDPLWIPSGEGQPDEGEYGDVGDPGHSEATEENASSTGP